MASLRLDATDVPGSREPVARGDRRHHGVNRNAGVARQKEGRGKGPHAALGPVRPGGLVVAEGVARWAASGPDADVEEMGWRALVAAAVLAAPSVAYALPATQSQAFTGVGERARCL